MEKSLVFNINGTGLNVDLVGIIGSTLMAIVVFAICYALSRKVEMKPNKKQNVLEYLIDFTDGIVKDNVEDPAAQKHLSLYAFVLFLFIFCMNQLGLFLEVKVGDYMVIKSPTADPVTTMSFAMMTLLLSFTFGIQKFGTKGYLQNYARPVGFLLPINIIEEFTNFLTLSLRLYGNIFAGEVLLTDREPAGAKHGDCNQNPGCAARNDLARFLCLHWLYPGVCFCNPFYGYIGKKVTQE